MNNEKVADLRELIADESISINERKLAAEHAIRLQLEDVEIVGVQDDDHEVIELTTPWADQTLAAMCSSVTNGRSVNGWNLTDAKKTVKRRLALRALLAVVVDESKDRLERLAACRVILDEHLHPRNTFRMSSYNEERLLDAVVSADAMKWTSEGQRLVERPPQTLADVW